MQEMGNTKARLLYEANLPENFRRPQTDQYPFCSGFHIEMTSNASGVLRLLQGTATFVS